MNSNDADKICQRLKGIDTSLTIIATMVTLYACLRLFEILAR